MSGFIGTLNVGGEKKSDYVRYKKSRPSMKKCKLSTIEKTVNFKMAKDASLNSSLWKKEFNG